MAKKNPDGFQVYVSRAGLWHWRFWRRGRIIAESGEGYARERNARRAIAGLAEALVTQPWTVRK